MSSENKYFAFTLCSNNYLAQANVLKESFLQFNPGFVFYIGLVDKLSPEIDYDLFKPAVIVPIDKVKGINVKELTKKFDIVEFNTCVKPSFFKHIIKQHQQAEIIHYIDPDICFFNSIDGINSILTKNSIALTPHITSPIRVDEHLPTEQLFLNFGIYNLGYLGVNAKSPQAIKMLDWWEEKTLSLGYNNTDEGLFVDQLWMNFVPIFYDSVVVLRSCNYNMAPWNLHERHIVSMDGKGNIVLNDGTSLVFYHFSNLNADRNEISKHYKRFNFIHFPLLKKLYDEYFEKIEKNGYSRLKSMPIAYSVVIKEVEEEKPEIVKISLLKRIIDKLIRILQSISDKL